MANNVIDLVPLDFDDILNSFRNTLRDNDQFKDFDFEGSNMRLLLEIMSYNAQRTGFYQNMVLNESFLDSAIKKNSAMSRAKDLNYLPNSPRSSRARIKVEFEADGTSAPYIIPKGSLLTSLVKNDSFTFSIPESITVASANNSYEFETDIYEGWFVSDTYTYQAGQEDQRFEITNKQVDLDSLTVTVYEDGNEIGDSYVRKSTLLDLDENSKVYFVQPSQFGYYEIRFGDNNLGRAPKGGSTIVLNYRINQGSFANGARLFTLDFDPTGADELTGTATVSTLQDSRDGQDAETLESIKFLAPRYFQTQERTVSASDYQVALKKQFPEINAVYAYGGEDLSPPRYGRVYCAVDISNIDGLPDSKKQQYGNFLKNRTTFGIRPTFVEPEFTYLQVNTKVRYNLNVTDNSEGTMLTLIRNAVKDYNDQNLDDFNVILRESKMVCEIDGADPSIISSQNETLAYKKINPTLGALQSWTLNFGAALRNDIGQKTEDHASDTIHICESSIFTFNSEQARIEDDSLGNLRIVAVGISGNDDRTIKSDIGTIDYDTGKIQIIDLKVDKYLGSSLKIFVRMKDPDISAKLNNILTIEDDEINVTLEPIRV